jgi:hypothetical protein
MNGYKQSGNLISHITEQAWKVRFTLWQTAEYTGHTQNNGAVLIANTIKTAPFFCVCPVHVEITPYSSSGELWLNPHKDLCNVVPVLWRFVTLIEKMCRQHNIETKKQRVYSYRSHCIVLLLQLLYLNKACLTGRPVDMKSCLIAWSVDWLTGK